MVFERVCALSDLRTDEALRVTLGRYDIALVRATEGGDEVLAIEDLCSHAAVALSEGEVVSEDDACQIECWLHGSMFDLRTGKPTTPPATAPVATFRVDVRDGDVHVDTENTLNGVTPS